MPVPRADQLAPSQTAIELAVTTPAISNDPPTNSLLLEGMNVLTKPSPTKLFSKSSLPTPRPRADQAVPSQRAILLAATPSMLVKPPPTYRSLPLTTIVLRKPMESFCGPTPLSSADQVWVAMLHC